MPQFVLNQSESPSFQSLDPFTQGYITSLFFTDSGQDEGQIPADCGFEDLSDEFLRKILEDCKNFQDSSAHQLAQAYSGGYEPEHAGTDFWLTRNRHGAGFWNQGLGQVGNELTEIAHAYGEVYTCQGDDGKIYGD